MAADRAGVPAEGRTVVVEDLSVTYRVVGGAPSRGGGRLQRALHARRRTQEIPALRDVSLTIRRGECVGVVGRNGAGKSTLLGALAGLVPASSGRVLAVERPVLLGISAALLPGATGAQNILVGGLALGLSRVEVEAQYDEVVELAGIGAALHRPMRTYSAGMAARLRFAIATMTTPQVLLLDEALNAGDADFQHRSKDRIARLTEQAGTVVLVSHTFAAMRRMCTRVLWLDGGRLRADGEPNEVIAAYREHVYAGLPRDGGDDDLVEGRGAPVGLEL